MALAHIPRKTEFSSLELDWITVCMSSVLLIKQ